MALDPKQFTKSDVYLGTFEARFPSDAFKGLPMYFDELPVYVDVKTIEKVEALLPAINLILAVLPQLRVEAEVMIATKYRKDYDRIRANTYWLADMEKLVPTGRYLPRIESDAEIWTLLRGTSLFCKMRRSGDLAASLSWGCSWILEGGIEAEIEVGHIKRVKFNSFQS